MRFTGTCEWLSEIDAADLARWISSISFAEWPQQKPIDEQLRPAMVTDLNWHGFGEQAKAIAQQLTPENTYTDTWMLSVVMPGHLIEPHTDGQPPYWLHRVHVPLLTNPESRFIVGGVHHHMEIGQAYRVSTEVTHSVENNGKTPRVHFIFDVKKCS